MKIQDIVRAIKTDVHVTDWKEGHIPRATFPLSQARPKNYKFGPEYKWRLVRFDCLGNTFRLLVVFNEAKQIYRATLGMDVERDDLVVLCQHEFHASEPGWHCHVTFAEAATLPHGVSRTHLRRWPGAGTEPSRLEFGVRLANAVSLAAARFRISSPGTLL